MVFGLDWRFSLALYFLLGRSSCSRRGHSVVTGTRHSDGGGGGWRLALPRLVLLLGRGQRDSLHSWSFTRTVRSICRCVCTADSLPRDLSTLSPDGPRLLGNSVQFKISSLA